MGCTCVWCWREPSALRTFMNRGLRRARTIHDDCADSWFRCDVSCATVPDSQVVTPECNAKQSVVCLCWKLRVVGWQRVRKVRLADGRETSNHEAHARAARDLLEHVIRLQQHCIAIGCLDTYPRDRLARTAAGGGAWR
jgi:hypothetical protein